MCVYFLQEKMKHGGNMCFTLILQFITLSMSDQNLELGKA